MSLPPTSNTLDRVELLAAELKAIEHWDADYWRKAQPEIYETRGYTARRERRAEILSQLRCLIRQLDNYEGMTINKPTRTTGRKG